MNAMTKGCLAGTGVCFVSHRGEVFPCGYLPVEAGNIRQQPFREIWEEFAALRRTARSRPAGRQVRPVRVQERLRRLPRACLSA